MYKIFLGMFLGMVTILAVHFILPRNQYLGGSPSNGDLLGIYNATPTDMVLRDGFGSALLVDSSGRLILSPSSTVAVNP